MKNKSIILDKLQEHGTLQELRDILLKLVQSDPTNQQLNYHCGIIMSMLGFDEESIILFQQSIIQGIPSDDLEDIYFSLGYMCITSKRFEKALFVLDEGLENYPENNSLKVLKSIALHHLGKNQESLIPLFETLLLTSSDKKIITFRRELITCLETLKGRV